MSVELCNERCVSVNETYSAHVLRSKRLFGMAEYLNTVSGCFQTSE